jgi:hypothetical protein
VLVVAAQLVALTTEQWKLNRMKWNRGFALRERTIRYFEEKDRARRFELLISSFFRFSVFGFRIS